MSEQSRHIAKRWRYRQVKRQARRTRCRAKVLWRIRVWSFRRRARCDPAAFNPLTRNERKYLRLKFLKIWLVYEAVSAAAGAAVGGAWPWLVYYIPTFPDPWHVKTALHALGVA